MDYSNEQMRKRDKLGIDDDKITNYTTSEAQYPPIKLWLKILNPKPKENITVKKERAA